MTGAGDRRRPQELNRQNLVEVIGPGLQRDVLDELEHLRVGAVTA
jgi:hypothetical protein